MNNHLRTTRPDTGRNLLAVDAGQTGIKLRWFEDSHARQMLLPGVQTHSEILPQLAAAIDRTRQESGRSFDTIAVGTTGLTRAEHDAGRLLTLLRAPEIDTVLLAHDSVTSYLGALADGPGAVVAAGTGVVTLAVGPRSVARVDGWGHIMGDAGSAYWIGQQVLIAVMRAHDGRGQATALTEPVSALWPDLEEAYLSLQSSADRVATVAAFARSASELAAVDPVAADICRRAARELAASVAAGLDRVRDGRTHGLERVATLGGVFASELITREFAANLAELAPGAVMESTAGTGLDGAERLAELTTDHPLQSLVSRVGGPLAT